MENILGTFLGVHLSPAVAKIIHPQQLRVESLALHAMAASRFSPRLLHLQLLTAVRSDIYRSYHQWYVVYS